MFDVDLVEFCLRARFDWNLGALLFDLRIYELTNAVIENFLKDQERVKARLRD